MTIPAYFSALQYHIVQEPGNQCRLSDSVGAAWSTHPPVSSEGVVATIDPQRDIDIYLEAAARNGWKIEQIVETYMHADAWKTVFPFVVPGGDGV